jgi:hypothetical protein
MPKQSRIQLLLAKIESSYGTLPSPAPAGSDAILVRNLEATPLEAMMLERETVQPYLGSRPSLMVDKRVKITFEIEVSGSGTAGTAPKYGPILRACGLSQTIVADTSVTYAPVSTAMESVTLAYHADGIRHYAVGCRGTFELAGVAPEFFLWKVEMTGIYVPPTDTAIPSATYTNQAAPLVFGSESIATFSMHGFNACVQEFSLNLNNEMVFRNLAGCTQQQLITDRKVDGSVMLEMPTLESKDFFAAAVARTQDDITFQFGATAGNILTVTVGQAQLGAPAYGDSDGVLMLTVPYMALPTSAGNNELSLVFT